MADISKNAQAQSDRGNDMTFSGEVLAGVASTLVSNFAKGGDRNLLREYGGAGAWLHACSLFNRLSPQLRTAHNNAYDVTGDLQIDLTLDELIFELVRMRATRDALRESIVHDSLMNMQQTATVNGVPQAVHAWLLNKGIDPTKLLSSSQPVMSTIPCAAPVSKTHRPARTVLPETTAISQAEADELLHGKPKVAAGDLPQQANTGKVVSGYAEGTDLQALAAAERMSMPETKSDKP